MYLGRLYRKNERDFALRDMEGNPDTPATIKVRLLTPGERRDVFDAGLQAVFHQDDAGGLVPEIKGDNRGSTEKLFHLAVIGWSGIYEDAEGKKPLAFGAAGKRTLLDLAPDVAAFVAKCHAQLVEEAEAAKEPEQKN